MELDTPRLTLRRWREDDLEPFAALNADPEVMEFFPNKLNRQQSDALAKRADGFFDTYGYGLFAVERKPEADEAGRGTGFIGFVGLAPFTLEEPNPLPFAPGVEIGWRLARPAWGRGLATEAAARVLEFGFGEVGLDEIVSFTSLVNVRSQAVMERIGMSHDPADDFEHPRVPEGHRLKPHVLYRLRRC